MTTTPQRIFLLTDPLHEIFLLCQGSLLRLDLLLEEFPLLLQAPAFLIRGDLDVGELALLLPDGKDLLLLFCALLLQPAELICKVKLFPRDLRLLSTKLFPMLLKLLLLETYPLKLLLLSLP